MKTSRSQPVSEPASRSTGNAEPSAPFTRGPWIVGHKGHGVRVESEHDHGVANDGWVIAEFYGPDADGNAVITAAAPDLHDALQDLVHIINKAGLNNLACGVQLGRMSWLVKATERLAAAEAALERVAPILPSEGR